MTSNPAPRPKTIAYVSGTRADFGLMTPVLSAIAADGTGFSLRLYATGMHLMPVHGSTVEEIRRLFPNVQEIPVRFSTPGPEGIAAFQGELITRLTKEFTANPPDLVLILGDRVEMLATACVCAYLGIPIAHLHGGELTGTVDDRARKAISAMADLHLPATAAAATRIAAMGVDRGHIRVIGAPALDIILHKNLPSREDACRTLGLDPSQPFVLITQHPVSETWEHAAQEMRTTLEAVASFNLPVVVIYPNADAGGAQMIAVINEYKKNPLFHMAPHIPYETFLALEREAAVWVGNSSAGVIESASFRTPVVNLGSRQRGRERGANVIDAPHNQEAIRAAINRALHDATYRASLTSVTNPWGDGRAAERAVRILQNRLIEKTSATPTDRFTNWKPPEIQDGEPTKWQWIVRHPEKFRMGTRVDIGSFTYIQAQEGVTLDDEVQIGSHCSIYSVSTIDGKRGPVHLKKNARVGSHSTIMPGVTIGENAVIGAHSFVKTDIPASTIAYGVPAKPIRPNTP